MINILKFLTLTIFLLVLIIARSNDTSLSTCQDLAMEFYAEHEDEADKVWKIKFEFSKKNNKCFVFLNGEKVNLFDK